MKISTDDASRYIISMCEVDSPTTEDSIRVLDEGYNKYKHIRKIREVIVEHISQFYPTKKNKDGEARHGFVEFSRRNDGG